MRKKVSGYFTDGQAANLYYLVDQNNFFHNVVSICGEPWVTKNMREKEAVIYTWKQMVHAKEFLQKNRKLKVYETSILRIKKKQNETI